MMNMTDVVAEINSGEREMIMIVEMNDDEILGIMTGNFDISDDLERVGEII